MSTIDIVNDIKENTQSNLTTAQIAYELKKAASGLTKDKIKDYQSETLSEKNKEEALEKIASFLCERETENQLTTADILTDITENNIEKLPVAEDVQNKSLTENDLNDKNIKPPTNDEVKSIVIPVIANKIINNGKDGIEKNTVTYDSDNFSAMLRLGDEEQTISLDRRNAAPEDINALVASKGNEQQEYQIIINNLNKDEFDKFKALFEKEKESRKEDNKENKNEGNELD